MRRTIRQLVSVGFVFSCGFAVCQSGPNTALMFDGIDQQVAIPGFCAKVPSSEITVEFWENVLALKTQSTFSQDDSQRSGFDPSNVFNAHVPYADGTVYWDFGDITAGGRLSYTPPVPLVGTWQHFALEASRSGNFMRIYRDGILEADQTNMTIYAGGSFDLDIGGEVNALFSNAFEGTIDEFRIWSVARTQAEIRADMYRCLDLPRANLVAYWRFDDGSGNLARDATENGNDGALVNGPAWVASTVPSFTNECGTASSMQLAIGRAAGTIILTWPTNATGFNLQSAPAITGSFTNIPSATSPYTNTINGSQQFFRLAQ